MRTCRPEILFAVWGRVRQLALQQLYMHQKIQKPIIWYIMTLEMLWKKIMSILKNKKGRSSSERPLQL